MLMLSLHLVTRILLLVSVCVCVLVFTAYSQYDSTLKELQLNIL